MTSRNKKWTGAKQALLDAAEIMRFPGNRNTRITASEKTIETPDPNFYSFICFGV